MATREGTRASAEFICVSIVPDVCKSPNIPVPYKILSLFDCAVNFSTNVRFRTRRVFRHNSRLSTVRCDEAGVGGGVLSGVNLGFCRPIDGTSSTTVRVNGSFVDYHEGTYMFMNCAGPEGPFNTIGQVLFLGNMLPGPVSPSGKIPKGCICGESGILSDIQSSLGDVEGLIAKGKMLYSLAQTDWSNPSAVLGAIGGVAGIAGLQDVADLAANAKKLYDTGKQVMNTDWSDPLQALGAVAGVANVAGMSNIAKVAGLASTITGAIKADWSDPKAALAAATNIMKATGLNQMAAQMLSNAILDSNIPVSQNGTTPPFFPKPGATANGQPPPASSNACNPIPPSPDGLPRQCVTQDALDYLQVTNPAAYDRFVNLSPEEQKNAFIETQPPAKDSNGKDYSELDRTAIYVPGDGFSTSTAERDGLPNVSTIFPDGLKEYFVASKDSPSVGSFFGIKEKEGNVYLFGGLVDLGSPEMPGAGNTIAWWVPDRILNMDMSPYYDYHDKGYYGSNVKLSDLGTILQHEVEAFKAGANMNPLQLPLQALYSLATTTVGVGTATYNSMKDAIGDLFGNGQPASAGAAAQGIVAGGCFPGASPPAAGSTIPGIAGPISTGTKPAPPAAPNPAGNASGAGKDGVLITTKQGNPAAAAAAIEAQFRKDNPIDLRKSEPTSNNADAQSPEPSLNKPESDPRATENKRRIEDAVNSSPSGIAVVGCNNQGGGASNLSPPLTQGYDHVLVAYKDGDDIKIVEMNPTGDDAVGRNFGSPNPPPRTLDEIAADYDSVTAVPITGLTPDKSSRFLERMLDNASPGKTYSLIDSDFWALFLGDRGETCASVIFTSLSEAGIRNSLESKGDFNLVRPDQILSWIREINRGQRN